jgi:beta-glucanase (GH16 family)
MMTAPDGQFTIRGGAVVSRTPEAFYGYYEVRMKASKISMSSTFWMSNRSDAGGRQQELDIDEAVGAGTKQPNWKNFMKSNTHIRCKGEDGKQGAFSAPGQIAITPPSGDDFHVYGAWWVDANTVRFYHNNEYAFTINPSTACGANPLDRPMQINMVTETYNWETPPTPEELRDDSINTTYYDWVRAYRLVK